MNSKARFLLAGGWGIPLLAINLYGIYDRNANFALVDARVTQVEKVCIYHPGRNSSLSKNYIRQTCADAERFAAQDRPAVWGWMEKQYSTRVDYISPVDQKPYTQRMYFHAAAIPGELNVGDVVSVLASKTDRYLLVEK
jgi:hypothetical protein